MAQLLVTTKHFQYQTKDKTGNDIAYSLSWHALLLINISSIISMINIDLDTYKSDKEALIWVPFIFSKLYRYLII